MTPRRNGSFVTDAVSAAVAFTASVGGGPCVMNIAMGCVFTGMLFVLHEESMAAAASIIPQAHAARDPLLLLVSNFPEAPTPIFPKPSDPLVLNFL
jgi:hypothetical protein